MKKVIIIIATVIGIALFGLLFASVGYTKASERLYTYQIESIRCEDNHYLITTEDSNYKVSNLSYYVDDPGIKGYITIIETKELFVKDTKRQVDSVKINIWYSDIHVIVS